MAFLKCHSIGILEGNSRQPSVGLKMSSSKKLFFDALSFGSLENDEDDKEESDVDVISIEPTPLGDMLSKMRAIAQKPPDSGSESNESELDDPDYDPNDTFNTSFLQEFEEEHSGIVERPTSRTEEHNHMENQAHIELTVENILDVDVVSIEPSPVGEMIERMRAIAKKTQDSESNEYELDDPDYDPNDTFNTSFLQDCEKENSGIVESHTRTEAHNHMENQSDIELTVGSCCTDLQPHHKKRKRNPEQWKRNKKKALQNSGKEYINTTGKTIPAKSLQPYEHTCKYQCDEFTEEERQSVFQTFWGLGDFSKQTAFIRTLTTIKKTNENERKRKQKVVQKILHGRKICKPFLLKTLGISQGRYQRALGKGADMEDKRGKHVPKNKTPQHKIDYVHGHIKSIPVYVSHYSRHHNPNMRYLPPGTTKAKLYNLYKELCMESEREPVSEYIYREVFNSYNIKEHRPQSDTCSKCDVYNNVRKYGIEESEKQKAKEEHELHLHHAKIARSSKRKDTLSANEKKQVIMFDLEKTLPTPLIPTNKVYYMRQLWVYNLGIHDVNAKVSFMNMWDESIASRGSQEIGSCLLKYAQTLPPSVEHLVAWSDCCGGQNRNQNLVKFFMYMAQSLDIKIVDHKFLEPGHSFMECDQDFGIVEKAKKRTQEIFTPKQWQDLVKEASKNFIVNSFNQGDFKSVGHLDVKKPSKNEAGQKIKWFSIRWIRVTKEEPFIMQYKETHDEEMAFSRANFRLKKIGRPTHQELSPLYNETRAIKNAKWKDLMALKQFIPPMYHAFYDALKQDQPATKSKQGKRKANTVETIVHPDFSDTENDDDSDDEN